MEKLRTVWSSESAARSEHARGASCRLNLLLNCLGLMTARLFLILPVTAQAKLTFPRPNPEVAGLPKVEVDPNEALGPAVT